MSTHVPSFSPADIPPGTRLAVVAARFNQPIVDELLTGCLRRLAELGVNGDRVEVHRVPGAFELPLAAQAMARTRRFAAVICLGCVIRGDTPHFDYVAGESARGVSAVALAENLPVVFGVLTCNTEQQAWDRAGGANGHAGIRAAETALEMVALLGRVQDARR